MCWDISLHTDIEILKEKFPQISDYRSDKEMDMRYYENVQAITFPDYPIIYREKQTGELGLVDMEWGILPTYIKDPKQQDIRRRSQVNIRSERILGDKKSTWYRLKSQRCLIPVSGTFEHREIKGWKKKVPYYIAEKDRDIFFIPGLYQWHEEMDADGVLETVGSFGMLTRAANPLMANIHNAGDNRHRMPLFLPPELEKEWLSDIQEIDMASIVSFEMPEENLIAYPVYTLRGYPERPDGKHRYEPFEWNGLPPLGEDDPNAVQSSLF
ncbi:MAG: SOS response-associated peptidase family protein [Taibaiella sp.]|nr:SOS response-associated peptidase family protein [Taibaiella sp.]